MQKRKFKKKLLLTGGHGVTTAIATIQRIKKSEKLKNYEIHWIGSKTAYEGKNFPTLDVSVFPKIGVREHFIIAGKLQTKFNVWAIYSILKIPLGFLHALFLLLKIRPSLILSFGGYSSFPIVFVGWIFRIPIILHEQTVSVGRANKFSKYFAKKVAISKESSRKYFPQEKIVVTGNPVMEAILQVLPKKRLGIPSTIYITGGSRGSLSINDAVYTQLPKLLKKFTIIHHTGYLDYDRFRQFKNSLRKSSNSYNCYPSINPLKIHEIYKKADIVVARSGANTVSEVILTRRPTIFIPLPFAYLDEQMKNAEFVENIGLSKIINQSDLTGKSLHKTITNIVNNWHGMVSKGLKYQSPDRHASKNLTEVIEDLL